MKGRGFLSTKSTIGSPVNILDDGVTFWYDSPEGYRIIFGVSEKTRRHILDGWRFIVTATTQNLDDIKISGAKLDVNVRIPDLEVSSINQFYFTRHLNQEQSSSH